MPEHAIRQKAEKKLKVSWKERILSRRKKTGANAKREWDDANPIVKTTTGGDAGQGPGEGAGLVDDEGIEVDFYDCVFTQASLGLYLVEDPGRGTIQVAGVNPSGENREQRTTQE